jgi:uncharacterized protein
VSLFATAGGKLLHLNADNTDELCIVDIAAHLSKQCRWAGALMEDYKVAQHCYIAHELAQPEDKFPALMHDAHEYITTDIPRPVAEEIGGREGALGELKRWVDHQIFKRWPAAEPRDPAARLRIATIDTRLLLTEARDYGHPDIYPQIRKWFEVDPYPWKMPARPWIHQQAQVYFLKAAMKCMKADA